MQDIMLFGEGWNGEVRSIEQGLRKFNIIPYREDPHLREAIFEVIDYYSDNGDMYLVGYIGNEPLMEDIEEAIMRQKPKPI
ncbi:hypothetical protein [Yersinia bercovieri]|uniref:hypothetical protein n=1 Tax=Yersinia bercovieri TaxID=634 RepID=UPI0005E9BD14|nr:hypothetical protein [Yersinia bercovieri]CNI87502.1 Uncharacterised protein [Yersinia bercovieri]